MDIPWSDVRVFLAVLEEGSLSAAARQLGVAQPTVSRRLAQLEGQLGEPLFLRGVEGTVPTAYAEQLVEPARRMAEWAAQLERAAERRDTEPAGVVRVTAPPGVAFEFLAPFAAELRRQLPKVRLEVSSTVAFLDLSRRAADIALRTSAPRQRDLVTIASLELDAVPFATADYIARLPHAPRMQDIDWIAWAPPMQHVTPNPELARLIDGFRPVFASDDFLVQLRAAEEGVGAIFLGRAHHRFARATSLQPIPVDFPPVPSAMYAICARGALAIPRVRAVADLIATEFAHTRTMRSAPRA